MTLHPFMYGSEILFIGSFILFVNKILLYLEISFGWILGIIGISMLTPLVIHYELTTLLTYHIFLIILMSYGYYLMTTGRKNLTRRKEKHQQRMKIGIIVFALACCGYLYSRTFTDSKFETPELMQSVSGLGGALLLAFHNPRLKFTGWFSNIVSHCFAIYIMMTLPLPAYWVAFFQGASILFAILGMINQRKAFKSAYVPT